MKLKSARQSVLETPELLDLILSGLELRDNAQNARVCKLWSQVALDSLWKEVDDLKPLFNVLGCTEYNEYQELCVSAFL